MARLAKTLPDKFSDFAAKYVEREGLSYDFHPRREGARSHGGILSVTGNEQHLQSGPMLTRDLGELSQDRSSSTQVMRLMQSASRQV